MTPTSSHNAARPTENHSAAGSRDQTDPRGWHVLLTNDDSLETPLLVPFLSALRGASEIRKITLVLPAEEQSWSSMSVSRFRPIRAWSRHFILDNGEQIAATLLNGTPADCVHIGVEHFASVELKDRPDVIVSGINCGMNAGLLLSGHSGTVGAAMTGELLGFPSIAFSAFFSRAAYAARDQGAEVSETYATHWRQIASAARDFLLDYLNRKLPALPESGRLPSISCNLPWAVTPESPRRYCSLDTRALKPIFQKTSEGAYEFQFSGFSPDAIVVPESDFELLSAGHITYSLLPLARSFATAFSESRNT